MARPGTGLGAGAHGPPRRRHLDAGPRRGLSRLRRLLPAATALLLVARPAAAQAPATDDPLLAQQSALSALTLPEAWATSTAEGVRLAVLDSGVQADHPDLAAHLLDGGATDDLRGTGTHAAGVAAAVTDNGEGIAGAAPDAEILALAVLDDDGGIEATVLATGIAAATDAGSKVIALTLGGTAENLSVIADDAVREALEAAVDAGVVVVAGSVGGSTLPDDLPIVAVGTGEDGPIDPGIVTVPADGVLGPAPLGPSATWPDGTEGYEALDGIGPATALVAGTAALLAAQGLTPEEIADLLVGTAQNPDGNPALGAGTVDAATAVAQADSRGAGGGAVPTAGDSDDGLRPAVVGAIAIGAAVLAVGTTILIAGRRPRPTADPDTPQRQPSGRATHRSGP